MNVKIHKLWQYIGTTIEIKEDVGGFVSKGVYLVLGKDSCGYIKLGNLRTREIVLLEEYTEEDEVFMLDYRVNLTELVEFRLACCVSLIQDGWSVGGGMDLKPYILDYESLVMLKNIKDK